MSKNHRESGVPFLLSIMLWGIEESLIIQISKSVTSMLLPAFIMKDS